MQQPEKATVTQIFSGNDNHDNLLRKQLFSAFPDFSCLLNTVFTRTWLKRQIWYFTEIMLRNMNSLAHKMCL